MSEGENRPEPLTIPMQDIENEFFDGPFRPPTLLIPGQNDVFDSDVNMDYDGDTIMIQVAVETVAGIPVST